jgi:hypothetical protein
LDLDAEFEKNAGLEPIFNMYAGFAVFFKAYSGLKEEGVIPTHVVCLYRCTCNPLIFNVKVPINKKYVYALY